jgi:hypothetical protein
MPSQPRPRDFAHTDVPIRWHADGTFYDARHGRTYVTYAPPPPVSIPVVWQAVDAVALTSVITGLLVVLRISLRF